MKWLINLFARKSKNLPAPDPRCVVGHKRYYRIMPWK